MEVENSEQLNATIQDNNPDDVASIPLSEDTSNESSSDSDDNEWNEEEMKQKTEELKKQIEANPKDENTYKELIALYRKQGSIDEVRNIRVQYKQNLPLSPGFICFHYLILESWTEWIEDEKTVVSDDEEKESICQLYKAALKEYYSIDMWIAYLHYVNEQLPSQMSSVCEEALHNCISDCVEGLRIWAVVLQWSCDNQTPDKTESLYLRMLSHPYQSLEGAFDQYRLWHESIETPMEESVLQQYELAKKEYEKRDPYELELAGSTEMDHISTAYRHFQEYVQFEIKEMKNSPYEENRGYFLYVKYTFFFRYVPDFWNDYYLYALNQIKVGSTCHFISSRALKHICNSGSLYEHHLVSLELTNKKVSFLNDLIMTVNKQVLLSYYDYLHFYLACIASYRRRISLQENGAQEGLVFLCDHCVDWLVRVI